MHCKIINKQEENQEVIFSFDYIQLEEKREEKREKPGQKMGQKIEQNELKKNNIFSLNEIMISEKIKKIPRWQKYTSPILHSSLVSGLGKYLFVKEKMDFSLFSFYSYLKEKKEKSERSERSEEGEHKEKKDTFVQIISIYNSLLKVLEWTESNGIVSLSCNLNNIYFDKDKFYNVKLVDFSHSFFIKDTIELTAIMQINEFSSLGMKVLHYMNLNKCVSLSSNNIQEICSEFIDGLKRFFPLDFLQEYEKKCIFSLQYFINKEKERIILELLKGSSYWDHFSMSLSFLIILKVIDQDTNSNKFIREFTSILLNNILNSRKNEELTFC
jgi:hypothetical protein